jgi:hypothetical protein
MEPAVLGKWREEGEVSEVGREVGEGKTTDVLAVSGEGCNQ